MDGWMDGSSVGSVKFTSHNSYWTRRSPQYSLNVSTICRVLLAAAEDDIRLHRARLQAAARQDVSLLRTYQLETDSQWLARQQRLNERELMLSKLDTERPIILKELITPPTGLTAEEAAQVQLARWQRALELYVYSPKQQDELGMLELLEQLSEGVAEVSISASASASASTWSLGTSFYESWTDLFVL